MNTGSLTATIEFYKLLKNQTCNNEKVVSKGNHLNWQKKKHWNKHVDFKKKIEREMYNFVIQTIEKH